MTYSDYDIDVPRGKVSGEVATKCPRCSDDRKKHKNAKPLSVNLDKGVWKCNHCGWTGALNKKQYTLPKWENTTQLDSGIVEWFLKRNISQVVLNEMKVGQAVMFMPQVEAERKCMAFVYYRENKVVNVKYRDKDKNFRLVSGAELIFYNLDGLKDQEECFIVEGEIDALTMIQAGYKNTVSVPNGANLKSNNFEYIDNCWQRFESMKKIYIMSDADAAGEVLAKELSRRLGVERCFRVKCGEYKDINEAFCNGHKPKEFIETATPIPIEGVFEVDDFREAYWNLVKNGFPEGWKPRGRLGELVSFHPGYLTVITGVPSHGKSEMLDQVALDITTKYDLKGSYFTPENKPTEMHVMKLVEKLSGKSHRSLTVAETNKNLEYLQSRIVWTYPEEDFTIETLLQKIREAVVRYGINWFVFDPWNKIEHKKNAGETETDYVSRCLDLIANFCTRNHVHGFVIVHPVKMKRNENTGLYEVPDPYSISGSAHWYNKPDVIMAVHKENDSQDSPVKKARLYVYKVKFKYWGHSGDVGYIWDQNSGRYSESDGPVQSMISETKQTEVHFYESKYSPDESTEVPF